MPGTIGFVPTSPVGAADDEHDLEPIPVDGAAAETAAPDSVNHPVHYNGHPSGVECITIVEHFGFCIGNAIKYLWRAGLKGDAVEDLRKARWYIDREIERVEGGRASA